MRNVSHSAKWREWMPAKTEYIPKFTNTRGCPHNTPAKFRGSQTAMVSICLTSPPPCVILPHHLHEHLSWKFVFSEDNKNTKLLSPFVDKFTLLFQSRYEIPCNTCYPRTINLLMGICSVFELAMVRIMCHSSRHFHEFRLKIALLGGTLLHIQPR